MREAIELIRELIFLTSFVGWAGGVAPWRQELINGQGNVQRGL